MGNVQFTCKEKVALVCVYQQKAEGNQEDAKQHYQVFAVENIFLSPIY